MGMSYVDMSDAIRKLMIEEVAYDGDGLYSGSYITDAGKLAWKDMLIEACNSGSDETLAAALTRGRYINAFISRRTKNGVTQVRVPYTAANTVGESNFSRFYLRALSRFAIENDIPFLVGYRAMAVENSRPGSEEKIGMHFDPKLILEDLRATMDGQPEHGMPPGVGSGILARLPN